MQLETFQRNEDGMDGQEIKNLQKEIAGLLEQEDTRWKQRAKRNWYRNGNRNNPFFHAWASHRRKVNTIHKIQDDVGRCGQNRRILARLSSSFTKHFSWPVGCMVWRTVLED